MVDQDTIQCIAEYAKSYNCSLLQSAIDYLGEGPQTEQTIQGICNHFGFNRANIDQPGATQAEINEEYRDYMPEEGRDY